MHDRAPGLWLMVGGAWFAVMLGWTDTATALLLRQSDMLIRSLLYQWMSQGRAWLYIPLLDTVNDYALMDGRYNTKRAGNEFFNLLVVSVRDYRASASPLVNHGNNHRRESLSGG